VGRDQRRTPGDAVNARGVDGFGQGHCWHDGRESVCLDHSCLTHPFPLVRAWQSCARENAPHAMAGAENIQYSPNAVDPAASPERSPTDGVDDVVDTGHPRHAGEHEVRTGVMLLRRGGGTAITYHHAIIILVAGVPQRPLDDASGRVPRQDQGRDAEPPEVDAEIGGVEWAGGAIDTILSRGILPAIRIGSPGVHVT
jgi:hypothetical protein